MNDPELKQRVKRMRLRALKMALDAGANGAHLGPGLSMMEIAAVLFCEVMKISPERLHAPDRDRFILSKAHAVLAYYTALAECGILTEADLAGFEKNGSDLPGHPILCEKLGVEVPGGSLGMGLPFAVGTALAGKMRNAPWRTFVVMGDGECQEGSVWEAAMAAANYHLDHLFAVIDRIHLQYEYYTEKVMALEDLAGKWHSFGWEIRQVDGHDIDQLSAVLSQPARAGKPVVVIADTVKGKGVSFMENNREWHHHRLSPAEYENAINEVESER